MEKNEVLRLISLREIRCTMGKQSREKSERRLINNSSEKEVGMIWGFEKICLLAIEIGTYVALFTPLIFVRDYFFPFIVPKTVFFRIVVDLIFIPYVLLAIYHPRYRPKINALTVAIAAFIGIALFTSAIGVNFAKSFWSVFERMTGLLTFFHLFAFFIILTSVFKEKKYWERIMGVSIIVGILVVLYAWTSTEVSTRGGSTIGNTSFMSGYMLFNIFFAIILFFTKNIWWKIFSAATGAVLIASLFISIEPTQGAIGAFLISASFLGLSYVLFCLFSSGKKEFKIAGFSLIGLIIAGALIVSQLSFTKQWVVDTWNGTSIQSRVIIWKMAIEGWKERPLFGWGQENFNIPFTKYFDPQLPLSGDIWYDRTHNIIFDTLITSGILGLLSYLSILIVACWGLLRIIPKLTERKNLLIPLGMISLLMAYFIQDFFVFDMISSYMMFFLSLAIIGFLAFSPKEEPKKDYQERKNPLFLFLAIFLIIVSLLTIYFGNIQPARASKLVVRGLIYPLETAVPAFQTAANLSPISQFELPEQFNIRMAQLASQPVKDMKLLNQGFGLAQDELKESVRRDPLNYRLHLFLARTYNNFYQILGKPENLKLAESAIREAISLSPTNQQGYWTLGQVLLFEGRRDEAVENFKKAVDLEPRWGVSHWYLALAYKINNKMDLAAVELKEAERFGYNFKGNVEDLKKAIEVYKITNDKTALLPLLEKITELAPKEFEYWAELADLYAFAGEREKAKMAAEKVSELVPDKKEQVQEFLKSIGY